MPGPNGKHHHQSGTKLHSVWKQMWYRCRHKKTWLGLSIHSAWKDFNVFAAWALANGYETGLWLERKNNNEGYSPSNCCWATPAEQLRNTTRTVMVTAFGETKCAKDWSEDDRCKVGYRTLLQRLKRGIEATTALTTPSYRKTGKCP